MCRALSNEGAVASQEAGSRLIMALCKANQVQSALAVYDDMVLASSAAASSTTPAPPGPTATSDHARSSCDGAAKPSASNNSFSTRLASGRGSVRQQPLEKPDVTAADRLGLRRTVLIKGDWAAAPTRRKGRTSSKSFRYGLHRGDKGLE